MPLTRRLSSLLRPARLIGGAVTFGLIVVVGVVAGVFLECLDAVAMVITHWAGTTPPIAGALAIRSCSTETLACAGAVAPVLNGSAD